MLIKNVTDDTLDVPALGLRVAPGESVEVTGDDAKGLLANPAFERADKPTRKTDAAPSADSKE